MLSINHGSGTLTLQLEAVPAVTDRRWHRLDITSDGKVGVGGAIQERLTDRALWRSSSDQRPENPQMPPALLRCASVCHGPVVEKPCQAL